LLVLEEKMANKKILMGILVMALVFGISVVGCDDPANNNNSGGNQPSGPASIVVTNNSPWANDTLSAGIVRSDGSGGIGGLVDIRVGQSHIFNNLPVGENLHVNAANNLDLTSSNTPRHLTSSIVRLEPGQRRTFIFNGNALNLVP
jgi:hypothetical protein